MLERAGHHRLSRDIGRRDQIIRPGLGVEVTSAGSQIGGSGA